MLINIKLELDTNKIDKENKSFFESLSALEYVISQQLKQVKIPQIRRLKTVYGWVDFPVIIKEIAKEKPKLKPKPKTALKSKTPPVKPVRRKKS